MEEYHYMFISMLYIKKIIIKIQWAVTRNDLPGSFLALNEAFVIILLDTVTVVCDGVSATLIPIGPSLGWPLKKKAKKNTARKRGEKNNIFAPWRDYKDIILTMKKK